MSSTSMNDCRSVVNKMRTSKMDADPRTQFPFKHDLQLLRWMMDNKSEVLPASLELDLRNVSEQLQQVAIVFFLHLGGLAVPTDMT
jgi:hypothetical protein